jgi:eukaryotic-like serine/threonine-protein kinase
MGWDARLGSRDSDLGTWYSVNMALTAGTRLGPYEIVAPLGAGGMGEVYKARDTRLDRTVAIKVLPPHVLSDPLLRARFEREARTVSGLDHPNICIVHDVGREGDVEYIVMQYLDGETLAARLARGPLPLDDALRYGTEIAAALDKAHRAGVLHRDLKPGNVILSKSAGRDSSARLLDFGLAKVMAPGDFSGTHQPTATSPLTGQGMILGTLLYMSPEQLQGGDVDARSDIFSFGVLLYEMITGRRAFDAGSQASIIGAILERDPVPMATLIPMTPPALDRLVRKCLAKDRDRRWQSAADLCDELSWIAQTSGVQVQPAAAAPRAARRLAWWPSLILAGLLAAIGIAWLLWPDSQPVGTPARHVNIALPDGMRMPRGGIAVAPDNETIVFAASVDTTGAAGAAKPTAARLYVRRFGSTEVTPIAGTEGARTPFFSPDGQSVGYFTDSALLKVSLRGGPPVRVTGAPPVTRGGVWLPDGSMVVAPTQSNALTRVSADGQRETFTQLGEGDLAHMWPQLLPGGQDILMSIRRGTANNYDDSDIAVLNVASRKWRVILNGAAFGQYSSSGHLLFVRGGTLSAVPFNLAKGEVSGTPTPIVEGVAVDAGDGGAHFAVAPDGTLLFLKGSFGTSLRSAVWVDRSGKSVAAGIEGPEVGGVRVSPDGTRAVYDARSPDGDNEIYVADLARGTAVRFSDDPRDDFNPAWTPDGRRVIWTALPAGRLPHLVMRSADGTGAAEEIAPSPGHAQFAGSVSRDGVLAFTHVSGGAGRAADIWSVPLAGDRKAQPLIATDAAEYGPEFSPDGRWIAYVSNESGALDVYVVPYPGPGGKRRVTSTGAGSPSWSRDGRELFFQSADGLMAVDVAPGPAFAFGLPRRVFSGEYHMRSTEDGPRGYDGSPDGKRFLMVRNNPSPAPPLALHVIFNWLGLVKNAGR